MAYDLLIKNGRIIDGSGRPAFHGDVGVARGKIVELGRLDGAARRVIEADGRVVAPGLRRQPLPLRRPGRSGIRSAPSRAITARPPSSSATARWRSPPSRPASAREAGRHAVVRRGHPDGRAAGGRAVDVGDVPRVHGRDRPAARRERGDARRPLGRPALRDGRGVLGPRRPRDAELEAMRRVVREALEAGALGLSITRNMNHFDVAGKRIPAACAPESELFALADVLREVGTGVIQCGGGTNPELKDGLLSRISQACGRPIMYNTLLEQARQPGRWQTHLAHVEETVRQGIRAIPLCNPGSVVNRFTHEELPGVPRHADVAADPPGAPTTRSCPPIANPAMRAKLRAEVDAPLGPDSTFSKRWDLMIVEEPELAKNRGLRGQAHRGDRQGAGQAPARRVPRPGRRGEPGHRVQPRRDQHGHRGGRADPRQPVRGRRALRRRRPRAVPLERVATPRACSATGCARRASCRSSTPCAGSPSTPPRPSASTIAGCSSRAWRRTSSSSIPTPCAPRRGRRGARLPGERLAHARAGRGHPLHGRQRRGADGEGHAHRQPSRPRAAQRPVPGRLTADSTTRQRAPSPRTVRPFWPRCGDGARSSHQYRSGARSAQGRGLQRLRWNDAGGREYGTGRKIRVSKVQSRLCPLDALAPGRTVVWHQAGALNHPSRQSRAA